MYLSRSLSGHKTLVDIGTTERTLFLSQPVGHQEWVTGVQNCGSPSSLDWGGLGQLQYFQGTGATSGSEQPHLQALVCHTYKYSHFLCIMV